MKTSQKGQAIIELLVMIAALLLVVWSLLWLQRWQQIKLQTQHHAALEAFVFSQSHEITEADDIAPEYLTGLYSPIAHEQASVKQALGAMPASHDFLEVARQEGVLGATERWRFQSAAQGEGMQLQSQTSIWVGAGQTNEDKQMTERLESSTALWRYAQNNSTRVMKTLEPMLRPVDAAWKQRRATSNWLAPWQESVPESHLSTRRQ